MNRSQYPAKRGALYSLFAPLLLPLSPISLDQSKPVKLMSSESARFDNQGVSCVSQGNTLVVGAYRRNGYTGSAYVYEQQPSGWVEKAKLIGHDTEEGDYFGVKVGLSGSRIIVGAHGVGDTGIRSGAAYIFEHTSEGWLESTKLTASDSHGGDQFGIDVAIDGNIALVGAFADDNVAIASGSAYVFEKSQDGWKEAAKLTVESSAALDLFGWRVALSGTTAVIGAPLQDGRGIDSGAAYVFERIGSGWELVNVLTAYDAWGGGQFGHTVAIHGDTIVVGSPTDCDPNNGTDTGSAYIFERQDGAWATTAKITANDAQVGDMFGWDVSVFQDSVLVGSRWSDEAKTGSLCNSGSAYLFKRTANGWVHRAKLIPPDAACGDEFGYSVALSDRAAIVGAWLSDDACLPKNNVGTDHSQASFQSCDSGSVYVFPIGKSQKPNAR